MILGLLAIAQKTEPFPLTVESIMRGYALVGHAPRNLRWSEDGSKLSFQWAKADGTQSPPTHTYVVDKNGDNLGEGSVTTKKRNEWDGGSKLGDEVVYESGGDVFLYNTKTEAKENLTKSEAREYDPVYARDGKSVVFVRDGQIYRLSMADKSVTQLTTDKAAPDGAAVQPIIFAKPEGYNMGGISLSPSGNHATVRFSQPAKGSNKSAQMAEFITNSGYVELTPIYPRVGMSVGHSQSAVYDLTTGKSVTIATPRPGNVQQMQWSPDGKYGVLWALSEDHKDAWLYRFDTETEQVEMVYNEHDTGWVGGAWNTTLGWLPDSSKFYFMSENTGYNALLTMSPMSTIPQILTPGKYEVSNLQVDEEHGRWVYVSSEPGPADREIDTLSFDGKSHKKIADFSAGDDATFAISPDGTQIAVVKSKTNRPAELWVNNKQITETPTKEWLSGPWIDAPIVTVTARDGEKIAAKLFKPKDWRKGGPGVVFVHGAGYLQNVFHGWSYYFREYMFHHLLMSKGYAVLDVDYRASAGYGKAWRTAIYRHMGGKDLDDVVDGANYLVKEVGAAPDRLGVYGGSYGGFITFMAMFTSPDTFKSGAALRPVGDWSNYNHGYTSPILNNPQDDPDAYKQSSPINFVSGLKGNLLICHGMVDSNVQFQDSVRVVQKLIELGKKNWWVAPYPVENHGFVNPESWADEYNRIFDLFESTIGTKRPRK